MRRLVLALVLLAAPATADPNPQLLASIRLRLSEYGLKVDVSQLSTRQAAALHLTMARDEDGYFETRRKLKAILNWQEEDER